MTLREIDCSCTSGESLISATVIQMNIHKNPDIAQSVFVIRTSVWPHSRIHPKLYSGAPTSSLTSSAKFNYVTGSLWECLRVAAQESQDVQIPELPGLMQWPSCTPGSAGGNSMRTRRSSNNQGSSWERQ